MPYGRGIRQVEVGAAAGADLDVELERLLAVRALALGFVLLEPVEDHRDQAEQRQDHPDHEPDPERAALCPGDDAGGEAEEKGDDEVLHAPIVARPGALAAPPRPSSPRS